MKVEPMKDIAARELKGHNILAVERFWDSTFWMIEFIPTLPPMRENMGSWSSTELPTM